MLSFIAPLLLAAGTFTPQPTVTLPGPVASVPRFEAGVLSQPLTGDLAGAVRTWALTNRERYGLPANSNLRFVEAFSTRFGASFHLQQEINGVDVYLSKLVVTLDASRRVVQVASSLTSSSSVQPGKRLTVEQAMDVGAASIPLVARRDDQVPYGGGQRLYFSVAGSLHAGWLLHVSSIDLRRNWYAAVDEVTGERLFVQDRVHHGALDAQIYPISPGGLDAGVGVTPTVATTLTHADGGSLISDTCITPLIDGGMLEFPNDAGELCGDQLMMYNCCPTAGCVPDAGAARARGTTTVPGVPIPIPFDLAQCDRRRRASNVTNPSGNFVYTPVDPPVDPTRVDPNDRANADEFAEVHAFVHVNAVYDWARGLSRAAAPIYGNVPVIAPFKMRDEKRTPAVRVSVWTNLMFPDFNSIFSQGDPECGFSTQPLGAFCNRLLRIDNAAFLPRENFEQIPLPGFDTGSDTLLIFQGNSADAAYDSTVIQHEFGHGVVYATANLGFAFVAQDSRSVNNESGALHEGFADYIAAAYNDVAEVGPYFGPRVFASQPSAPGVPVDGYLRSMTNTTSCPSVLWGEVHEDSQHVAGALWDGRLAFRGTDRGATYDAAFYAMLVSITPTADFTMVAQAMRARVATAFASDAAAGTKIDGFFAARGVTGCSKVLDANATNLPRVYFGVSDGSQQFGNSVVPGPLQFKVPGTAGVLSVTVSGIAAQGSALGGQPNPSIALYKVGAPITFTASGGQLNNDSDGRGQLVAGAQASTITLNTNAACGQDVYVTIGATGGATLQNVNVTFVPLTNCMVPVVDAGMGGGTGTGGGTATGGGTGTGGGSATGGGAATGGSGETVMIPSVGPDNQTSQPGATVGCGCMSGGELGGLLLGLTVLLRRRAKR